jgi:hypothetical protein
MPSKQFEDKEGNKKYSPFVRFPDKTRWAKFQQEAIKAFDEYLSHNQEQSPSSGIADEDIPF